MGGLIITEIEESKTPKKLIEKEMRLLMPCKGKHKKGRKKPKK